MKKPISITLSVTFVLFVFSFIFNEQFLWAADQQGLEDFHQAERYVILEKLKCSNNEVLERYVRIYEKSQPATEGGEATIVTKGKSLDGDENNLAYLIENYINIDGTSYRPSLETISDVYVMDASTCPVDGTKVSTWSFDLEKKKSGEIQNMSFGLAGRRPLGMMSSSSMRLGYRPSRESYQVTRYSLNGMDLGSEIRVTDLTYVPQEKGESDIVKTFSAMTDMDAVTDGYGIKVEGMAYKPGVLISEYDLGVSQTPVDPAVRTVRKKVAVYALDKMACAALGDCCGNGECNDFATGEDAETCPEDCRFTCAQDSCPADWTQEAMEKSVEHDTRPFSEGSAEPRTAAEQFCNQNTYNADSFLESGCDQCTFTETTAEIWGWTKMYPAPPICRSALSKDLPGILTCPLSFTVTHPALVLNVRGNCPGGSGETRDIAFSVTIHSGEDADGYVMPLDEDGFPIDGSREESFGTLSYMSDYGRHFHLTPETLMDAMYALRDMTADERGDISNQNCGDFFLLALEMLGLDAGNIPQLGKCDLWSWQMGKSSTCSYLPLALKEIEPVVVPEGETVTIRVEANNAQIPDLKYGAENLPAGATFEDQIFSWTPQEAGAHVVTFKVTDCCTTDKKDVLILVTKAICGDNKVNQRSEQCDGRDLRGYSCEEGGLYVGGRLACDEYCHFDFSGCVPAVPDPTITPTPSPTITQTPAPTRTPTPTSTPTPGSTPALPPADEPCTLECGDSGGDGWCGMDDGCGGTCECEDPDTHCDNYSCVPNPTPTPEPTPIPEPSSTPTPGPSTPPGAGGDGGGASDQDECTPECGDSGGDGWCGMDDGCGGICGCEIPGTYCQNYSCIPVPTPTPAPTAVPSSTATPYPTPGPTSR